MRWNVLWLVGAVGCSSVSMGDDAAELADAGAVEGRTLRSEGDAEVLAEPLEPDAGVATEADSAPASEPEAAAPACPTWFRDADGDGYGDPSNGITTCEGQPDGYVRDSTDCYDENPEAYPRAHLLCVRAPDGGDCIDGVVPPKYYGEHRGDGSYDYNCDGEESSSQADLNRIGVVVCLGQPPASTFVPPCGEEGYFTRFSGAEWNDAKQGWGTCDGQGITSVIQMLCI